MVSDVLKGGFQITDMEIFHLEKANAEEFLEVYKDVVIEYHVGDRVKDSMINHSLVLKTLFLQQKLMLDQFTSGKLVAM